MASELLLELPGLVVKTFALPQSAGLFLQSALVIVQSDNLSVAHGENGSLYHHYNFARRGNFGTIVDCVYLYQKRTFLVAFSDRSLVAVPLECKDVSTCSRQSWPKQPHLLHTADGLNTAIFCEGGYVCLVSLTESGDIPAPISVWDEPVVTGDPVSVQCNSQNVFVLSNNTAALAAPQSSKKKHKNTSSNEASLVLSVWEMPSLLESSVLILSTASMRKNSVVLLEGEVVISTISHSVANSISIVTSARWVKLDINGNVLFERKLSTIPLYSTEAGEQLVILGEDRKLSFYNIRYGTEVRFVQLTDANITASSAYWVVLYPTDVGKSSSSSSLQLICSKAIGSNGPSNLYRRIIGSGATTTLNSSLCDSVGKLCGVTAAPASASACATLSSTGKRQLQVASAEFTSQQQLQQGLENEETASDAGKRRRLSISVPYETSAAFLALFEQRCSEAGDKELVVEAWEWDLLRALACSGDLSLNKNKSLLSAAARAHRLDVVAAVVEYVTDLTEKQCVKVLSHVVLMPANDWSNVQIQNGRIVFSNSGSGEEKKSKKTKTSKTATAVPTTEQADVELHLNIVRCFMEAVLRRNSAFSAILLSDAVRLLSLPTAVLLLRIITHFMRGLSIHTTIHDDSIATHLSAGVTDEQLKRAVTWTEALLDGHFSALALHAVSHADTRRALTCAMATVSGSEEAAENVQTALGLWTHISRVIHNGGQQVKPITSLYQVEHLDLR